jgi:N-acetylglutamate synthase-like GNAT family acetyltransferase
MLEKMPTYQIRPATQEDEKAIRDLIRAVHINPFDLHWKHFLVAVDERGVLIGCGQIKVHRKNVYELASIAVVPEYRKMGLASAIIQELLAKSPDHLYLDCRASLEGFYRRFGFQRVDNLKVLPQPFASQLRLAKFLVKVKIFEEPMRVMEWKRKTPA